MSTQNQLLVFYGFFNPVLNRGIRQGGGKPKQDEPVVGPLAALRGYTWRSTENKLQNFTPSKRGRVFKEAWSKIEERAMFLVGIYKHIPYSHNGTIRVSRVLSEEARAMADKEIVTTCRIQFFPPARSQVDTIDESKLIHKDEVGRWMGIVEAWTLTGGASGRALVDIPRSDRENLINDVVMAIVKRIRLGEFRGKFGQKSKIRYLKETYMKLSSKLLGNIQDERMHRSFDGKRRVTINKHGKEVIIPRPTGITDADYCHSGYDAWKEGFLENTSLGGAYREMETIGELRDLRRFEYYEWAQYRHTQDPSEIYAKKELQERLLDSPEIKYNRMLRMHLVWGYTLKEITRCFSKLNLSVGAVRGRIERDRPALLRRITDLGYQIEEIKSVPTRLFFPIGAGDQYEYEEDDRGVGVGLGYNPGGRVVGGRLLPAKKAYKSSEIWKCHKSLIEEAQPATYKQIGIHRPCCACGNTVPVTDVYLLNTMSHKANWRAQHVWYCAACARKMPSAKLQKWPSSPILISKDFKIALKKACYF